MTLLGLFVTTATLLVVLVACLRRKRLPLPLYAPIAFLVLLAAECLMFLRIWPVSAYFTPIAWTAYIFMADGATFAISGRSLLRQSPRELVRLAVLSLPLWLIFEAYNLRLANWTYVGVPEQLPLALLGYGWSFATITPAILVTADLVASFGWFDASRPLRFSPAVRRAMIAFGAICLVIPIAVPRELASYLFVLVWIGFVFLLDPINYALGLPSLLRDLERGQPARFGSLLMAGWICGWFWEFWNFWASAKWHYIFPMFQRWKVFEMPAPGYLGFLPFALECYVMYTTAAFALGALAGPRAINAQPAPKP